jgi:hypothetical protein
LDDNAFKDEDCNEDQIDKVIVVDSDGLMTMDDNGLYDGVHELESLLTSMDLTLTWLHETMAKITIKCKEVTNIKLYDHVTSLLLVIASNIQSIYLAHVKMNPCI